MNGRTDELTGRLNEDTEGNLAAGATTRMSDTRSARDGCRGFGPIADV
jgi:hypothetical protein